MESFFTQNHAGNAEKIFDAIKGYSAKGGRAVTKTLLELYYVMVDKTTPNTDRILIGAALAYQVLPQDLLPKSKFGLLGFLDNAAALAFVYKKVKNSITPEISFRVNSTLNKWFHM